jgi:2'-5' RNA ligase
MHMTLLFYGSVSPEVKSQLSDLVRNVQWNPLKVRVAGFAILGGSALTLKLVGEPEPVRDLEARLAAGFRSYEDINERAPTDEPLGRMANLLDGPEWARMKARTRSLERSQGQGVSRPQILLLHMTVARLRKGSPGRQPKIAPPDFGFALERLCLYESHLGSGGSRYEVLASSM